MFIIENTSIPSWVLKSPDDLGRLIIEQRFSQAAMLAVKAKAFVSSIQDIIDSNSKSLLTDIIRKVDEKEKLLANTLLKSLSKLPNSLVRLAIVFIYPIELYMNNELFYDCFIVVGS